MKKTIAALIVLFITVSGYAQKGEQAAGINLNFGTYTANFGLGAKYQYGITDAIRLEGGFDYFFESGFTSMWDININAHYLFPFAQKFTVYPLVGFTYSNWKDMADWNIEDWMNENAGFDTEHYNKFGANIGAGIQYDFSNRWRANFDIKYQILNTYGQAVLNLGVVYKF